MTPAAHALTPERKVAPVLRALDRRYGRKRRHGSEEPLAVLVRGILSQNTSDVNSGRAYAALRKELGGWEQIAAAPARRIARAIKSGGLADQKARTIKAVMRRLADGDGYSLDFLAPMEAAEAERWLTAVKGVGIKTARLVLLFGFGRPVFVVDTHVLRVSRRLGLVPPKCGREKAHLLLDAIVADADKYSGHLNVIQHGRECCRAQRPLCDECPVSEWCLYVRGLMD